MIFTSIDKRNNMNAVRYYLCLCILMNHYNILTELNLPSLPRIFGGVGSFFAITGFLMFASYERHCNIKGYFKRRVKRILPPYVFVVIFSALALSLVSTMPIEEYFADAGFFRYLMANLIFLNYLEPSLPGVFDNGGVMNVVNASLWTMKGEVLCYILVPIVYRVLNRYSSYKTFILIALISVNLACYLIFILYSDGNTAGSAYILSKQFRLLTFFFIGALINVYLEVLRQCKWIILSIVLIIIYVSNYNELMHILVRPFTDSVLVIWFSMIGTWGAFLSRYNSLSYDIYLFHFPIIQTLLSLGIIDSVGAWNGLFLTVIMSFAFASLSWNLIGKPVLNDKKIFTLQLNGG